MPIFLEPGQKYPVWLECDECKPAESRPTFYARSQSMRGQRRIGEVLDRLTDDPDVTTGQLFDDATETLGEVICGWSNMRDAEGKEIAFSKDAFADVLTYSEARELMRKVAFNQHVQTPEKKD